VAGKTYPAWLELLGFAGLIRPNPFQMHQLFAERSGRDVVQAESRRIVGSIPQDSQGFAVRRDSLPHEQVGFGSLVRDRKAARSRPRVDVPEFGFELLP